MNKQLILGGLLSLGVSMTSHAETGLYNDNGEHSQYRHLIVFGDSLSDQGVQNQNPVNLEEIKEATYSTPGSKMWPEYVATALRTRITYNNTAFLGQDDNSYVKVIPGGRNFASGGATTQGQGITLSCVSDESETCYNPPSVEQQVDTYLASLSGRLDRGHNLYAFWAGANNVFITLEAMLEQTATPEDVVASAVTAATQEANIINNLNHHFLSKNNNGADFLVFNMPDLGSTPLGQQSAELSALLSTASQAYNATLYSLLQNEGIKAYYIDVNSLVDAGINNPAHTIDVNGRTIKFDNVTTPACGANSKALTCIPDQSHANYLFEDDIHPTGLGQYVIGMTAANCVTKGSESTQPYCELINH